MLSRLEEIALVAKCVLADDRHAFGRLVEAYQQSLRQFFMNLTMGDAFLSDDLAQDTFLKAYTSIRSFRGTARFGTWLYRIGYNEFISYRRRRSEAGEEAIAAEPGFDPSSSTEAAIDINAAMRSLSDSERAVVTLFYFDDLPIKRIADILLMPENTVKSHLHRAKQHLAQTINYQKL